MQLDMCFFKNMIYPDSNDMCTPVHTVKILLNAHTLINSHTPIWMPKMAILSLSFGIPGTSK